MKGRIRSEVLGLGRANSIPTIPTTGTISIPPAGSRDEQGSLIEWASANGAVMLATFCFRSLWQKSMLRENCLTFSGVVHTMVVGQGLSN
jgi:hypothetical protein